LDATSNCETTSNIAMFCKLAETFVASQPVSAMWNILLGAEILTVKIISIYKRNKAGLASIVYCSGGFFTVLFLHLH